MMKGSERAGLSALARDALSAIKVYEGASGSCRIDLSDNTSQWGTPPSLAKVLFGQASADVTRYPAPYGRELKTAIALYLGVDVDSIVTGCGSDDVLDCTIRAFGEKGETLAHLDPSFGMIPVFARVARLEPVGISINAEPKQFATNAPRIIYLCSPNNPTGGVLSRTFIEQVIESAPGLVIVDEAYAEFGNSSVVDLVSRYQNLIVTRTFSKAFGLAGLRIGYGIAAPAIAREVEKIRGPYKLNAVGESAAISALTNDVGWMRANVTKVLENRQRFIDALEKRGFKPLESQANFVLVPIPGAIERAAQLRDAGIEVRAFEGLREIGDAMRISIGPWEMMEECLAALERVGK
ncbi:MAG: aminotransferase class I/II-fold pyridoxal phosphate-dependent enzyme [Gemmatimonadales bacterium]